MTEEAKAEMLAMLAKLELGVERLKAERDEARAERNALGFYLNGGWVDCDHDGAGLPGCPTCEDRWSAEVRGAVQAHRDRVGMNLRACVDEHVIAERDALRVHIEAVTAERDCLRHRAEGSDRREHRLSQQIDAAARHLGSWLSLIHGQRVEGQDDPDALVGRAIAALMGGEG